MTKHIFSGFLLFCIVINTYCQDNSDIQLAAEYFQQGELEKASLIYEKLAKSPVNTQLIASDYLSLLSALKESKKSENFLKNAIKYFPNNMQYRSNLAAHYQRIGEEQKFQSYVDNLFKQTQSNPFQLSILGQYMVTDELFPQAIEFYNKSRDLRGDKSIHALELASVYRIIGDKTSMIEEYLNYASDSPNRLSYVKNLLQNYLDEEDDLVELESTLIRKMQENPNEIKYPELMIWLELQRKNFYGAFIQSRAIDKRNEKAGDRSLQIGRIALDNKSYEDAEEIFGYVAKQYPYGRNYSHARKLWMEARELKIKNSYPVKPEEIRDLTEQYELLYRELFPSPTSFEALRNMALLHAFYLGEIEKASDLLNQLVSNPRAGKILIAKSKLDLGDIYLLKGEPWESTLLYSQVEKSNKSSPLSYEAKLRNARLNYFTGNFSLAKGHLDILKKNTTRDISNDAIALGMLISDNTALDTTDQVMQEFADIELLIFQNKKKEAKESLLRMMTAYEHHSISDEIYWLMSKLELEFGNFNESITYLDKILSSYAYDILADDAAFKKAEIYDFQLKETDRAKELYQQFLIGFPGSLYVAEARKRYRKLRGDVLN